MSRQPKSSPSHLQAVEDQDFPLDLPEDQKAIIMTERDMTVTAFRQLGAAVDYCLPRTNEPLEDDQQEELHRTDDALEVWRKNLKKQGLNAAITLHQGVTELTFYGPNQELNGCFFAACSKLGISPRYAYGLATKEWASSILFKLSEDEANQFDSDYAGFRPKSFSVDGAKRGILIHYGRTKKRGKDRRTLLPGSLLWHEGTEHYDLLVWRSSSGQGPGKPSPTAAPITPFFAIIRAAAYAMILNVIDSKTWEDYVPRRAFSEWLARVMREGQAINSNIVFAKVSRAIIADPRQAEDFLSLICEQRSRLGEAERQRAECLEWHRHARKRLEADPTRQDIAGWAAVGRAFGDKINAVFRTALYVGAESTLLEDLADRYLFCHATNQFVDRVAFGQGLPYTFAVDSLKLRHAPDVIKTLKKPVEAFPLFVKSKLRRDVADVDMFPDQEPGSILRITPIGAIVEDDDFAPEHSRLIFNDWRGLYIQPSKTVEAALKAECLEKLDYMLSLVTNRNKQRAAWIKAHFGWILAHPGQKQQVALVCTGDQGTGKTFLCQNFAQAVFGPYAGTASVRALSGQFYIAGYVGKLWVSHDEFVTGGENAEILKTLIRSSSIAGELKGRDASIYTLFARLAFTSNEANPGISKGRDDRGLFQVTSISPASEGLLPNAFGDRMKREVGPFYESFALFLERLEVRQAYVRLLMDCAPATMREVEDLTYSATRDEDVAREHLTDPQRVAKSILEGGVIHDGYDIAMPFMDYDLARRVATVSKDMGIARITFDQVLKEYLVAGLIDRPAAGKPFLFKFKIGALQRLYGDYLGVPLHSHWPIEPNDDMPNDWVEGDPIIPWKGRRAEEERSYGGERDEWPTF